MSKVQQFTQFFEENIVMVKAGTLNADTRLDSLDDWDSLAVISLNAALDEHFGFTLSSVELDKLQVFGDILKYIQQKYGEN